MDEPSRVESVASGAGWDVRIALYSWSLPVNVRTVLMISYHCIPSCLFEFVPLYPPYTWRLADCSSTIDYLNPVPTIDQDIIALFNKRFNKDYPHVSKPTVCNGLQNRVHAKGGD